MHILTFFKCICLIRLILLFFLNVCSPCDFPVKQKLCSRIWKNILGFSGGSGAKNPSADAGDVGLIPGLGRSPRGGNGNPLQESWLKRPMDRGTWWATVQRVTEIQHDWACRDADKMIGIKLYTNVLLRTMWSKNFGRNRLRVSRRQVFIEEANSMNDRNILVISLYQLSIQSISTQVFLM